MDADTIKYLRDLADRIEKNQNVSPIILEKVSELFLTEKCENMINDNDDTFDEQEVMKFIMLGWYFYQHFIKDFEEKDFSNNKNKEKDFSNNKNKE